MKITSTSGPCITINNAANVWVDNVELGPCAGNGVLITGSGATGIRVTNSVIHTERAGPNDSGVGVYISGAGTVLVQGNQFAYNESSVYAIQATNIQVIGNYSLNPLGPFPRGQHVQFNSVAGGAISDNYGESRTTNVQYQPNQEDAINLWQSQQIQVLRNYVIGGWSPTGCGLIFDGTNNSNNLFADNTVVRTAQCGIGVASGVNNTVRGNKVLDPNIPAGSGNIGIYVMNYYAGTCSGIVIENNTVSNLLPSGTYNDYWDGGTCGAVTFSGNTLGSAARLLLTPEAVNLPPPPIPPIPYSVAPPPVPVISAVAVSGITPTSATVTWSTDIASSSKVEYGLSSTYSLGTLQNPTLVTAHSMAIAALTASTTYHYRVTSVGTAGGSATSADFTFTTASPPPPVPVISAVAVSGITPTSATVTWSTDIASSSKVEYGLSSTYSLGTLQNPTLVTAHSMVITALTASTTYHYRVTCVGLAGGSATSADFTFTTAPPPSPGARTVSPPITATSGQVIRGVKITSTSGPCITIANAANVWVDNVELGPCAGNGVSITGSLATGIRVTNSIIHTERTGDSGIGVYVYSATTVLVQGNQFSYNASSVYAVHASNIRVIGNYSLNPLGPSPRGHHVQFNGIVGGEISDNYGESRTTNVQYASRQESAISLWQSRQIMALRNYLVGGWSTSGCGVITEGGHNSDNVIADNTIIRTGQCGIAIASGVNNTVRGNKILDTNMPGGSGNIGIYVWNQYPGTCSGIIVEKNIVSNLLPSGVYNDYWNGGNCGPVLFSSNILGGAARPVLTPESIQLPPPPIPPTPYIAP